MSGYVWGLLTVPIGLAVAFACLCVLKAAYLLLGSLGKVGVIRFGKGDDEFRFRVAALSAGATRVVVFNKGGTGLVLFTGKQHDEMPGGGLMVYEAALRNADRDLRENYIGGKRKFKPVTTDQREESA